MRAEVVGQVRAEEVDQGRAEEEGKCWSGGSIFSSTDLRYRVAEEERVEGMEKRADTLIVEEINKFSRQGPGGTFQLKGYSSVRHCLLCEKNCTCLSRCMGPPPSKKSSVVFTARMNPSTIPGLADHDEKASTTD